MLILTRRPGEAIMVGNEVQVRVVGVKGNQVRIGVTAPPRIRVDREEIYLRNLERERRSALAPDRRLTGARVEGFDVVGTVPAPGPPAIAASSKDRIGDPLTPLHARGEGGTRGSGRVRSRELERV